MTKPSVPAMLQIPKLLEAFYSVSEDRLNPNGEALLNLVTLNEEKTKPDAITYTVDDCIVEEAYDAVTQIIGSLLFGVLGEVAEGVTVTQEWPHIIYSPVLSTKSFSKMLRDTHTQDPFGKFTKH